MTSVAKIAIGTIILNISGTALAAAEKSRDPRLERSVPKVNEKVRERRLDHPLPSEGRKGFSLEAPAQKTVKPDVLDKLLRQERRPTIAEFVAKMHEAYGKMPEKNPFGASSRIRSSAGAVADMVAQLEHAYPGGTWLPLGRDAVLIADFLESFYTSIGQPNRVHRLDASGTSFPHYRDASPATFGKDRPILYGFLKSNGLDLDHPEKQPPFIMIDVTSYQRTSQSRQLVEAAFKTWTDLGHDPKDLFDHVNFVGLPMGLGGQFISETRDLDGTKAALKAATSDEGPQEILYLGGASGLTYTAGWHEMFRDFERQPNGRVTTTPGTPAADHYRNEILADMYDVVALTSSPVFLQSVKDAAKRTYNYEFPTERTFTVTRYGPPNIAERPAYVPYTPRATRPPETPYIKTLRQRLKAAGKVRGTDIAIEFVKDMLGMWDRGTVRAQEVLDMREAIGDEIFWYSNEDLQKRLKPILEANPTFAKLLE